MMLIKNKQRKVDFVFWVWCFFCILEAKALELDTEPLPLKYLAVVDEACTPLHTRVLTSTGNKDIKPKIQ
jgi:hypothetical protein